jgi:hypothetical protein
MADRQISETAKALIAAKAMIKDERNWTQGDYGLHGGPVCAIGALHRASFSPAAHRALYKAADELFPGSVPATVNDILGFAAVHKMYDLAISRALTAARGEGDGNG